MAAARTSAGDAALAGLAAELQAAEDERAIRTLTHTYGYFLENGLWADMVDLFTDTAAVEYTGGPYVGKAQVRRYFLDRFGGGVMGLPPGRLANHMMLQGIVTLYPGAGEASATEAGGRWRSLIQNAGADQTFNWLEGGYEFFYVKTGGVWRIQDIHYVARVFGSYTAGWLDAAAVRRTDGRTAPPEQRFPPSGPPTETHQPYPAAYSWPRPHAPSPDAGRAAPAADTRDLAGRIARLSDRDAIENLQNRYGYHLDQKRWDDAAALFTRDARYEETGVGAVTGRAAIRLRLERDGPQGLRPGDLYNHMQMMPVITVAPGGGSAMGRWRFLAQLCDQGRDPAWSEGVYENRYLKVGGVWKIDRHHAYVNLRAPYGGAGWDVQAERGPKAPFPAYVAPPFHYPNPVTGRPIQIPEAPR